MLNWTSRRHVCHVCGRVAGWLLVVVLEPSLKLQSRFLLLLNIATRDQITSRTGEEPEANPRVALCALAQFKCTVQLQGSSLHTILCSKLGELVYVDILLHVNTDLASAFSYLATVGAVWRVDLDSLTCYGRYVTAAVSDPVVCMARPLRSVPVFVTCPVLTALDTIVVVTTTKTRQHTNDGGELNTKSFVSRMSHAPADTAVCFTVDRCHGVDLTSQITSSYVCLKKNRMSCAWL